MAKPHIKRRRCSFESLEDRRLLAGNVTAKYFNGHLNIVGDRLDNGITMTSGILPNQVILAGITAGGAPTGLNGTPNGSVTLPNVDGNVKINMKDGHDIVTINALTVKGNAKIKTGKGIDVVTVTGSTAGGKTKINLGGRADMLTITTSVFKGPTKIKAKSGNDMVGINNSTFRVLNTQLGTGNDMLAIAGTTAGKTILNGGKDVNTFANGTNNFLFNPTIKRFV